MLKDFRLNLIIIHSALVLVAYDYTHDIRKEVLILRMIVM